MPVYVAGDGPKALSVAGEVGDGWITTLQRGDVMGDVAGDFARALASVRDAAAAAAAGRSFDGAYTMWSNTLCVLEPGERPTDPRVLERAGLRNLSIWAPPPLTRQVVAEVAGRLMPLLRD